MFIFKKKLWRDSSCIDSKVTFKDWCKLTIKLINGNHSACQNYEAWFILKHTVVFTEGMSKEWVTLQTSWEIVHFN